MVDCTPSVYPSARLPAPAQAKANQTSKMSFVNVPGIPVYFVGPYGPVLYLVPFGTPFMEVQGYVVPPAVVEEHPVPEGTNNDDEFVDAETGEALPPEMQESAKEFAETVEALKWAHEEAKNEEEELAEVARYLHEDEEAQEALALENKKKEEEAQEALAFQIKMDEIHKKIQEMTALNKEHHELNTQLYIMRQVKDKETRDANNAKYQEMDAAHKAALTAWLEKYAVFTALFAECKAVDPNFRKTFNAYIKARLPAEPERDYEGLNARIARNNLAALNWKPAAVKAAPGTEKLAPAPAMLNDFASVQLAKKAAGGGRKPRASPLSALKSEPAVWGDV